jgi:tRNA U55 pseudouridine synthase TruB
MINQALALSCARAMEQLARVKSAIFAEARAAITAPQHLLRLALNEAEAQSWQTDYPHLVFPALAHEKVQSLSAWSRRQRAIYRAPRTFGA